MKCPKCGNELRADLNYCSVCGSDNEFLIQAKNRRTAANKSLFSILFNALMLFVPFAPLFGRNESLYIYLINRMDESDKPKYWAFMMKEESYYMFIDEFNVFKPFLVGSVVLSLLGYAFFIKALFDKKRGEYYGRNSLFISSSIFFAEMIISMFYTWLLVNNDKMFVESSKYISKDEPNKMYPMYFIFIVVFLISCINAPRNRESKEKLSEESR